MVNFDGRRTVPTTTPTPFELHESGAYLHGTRADLAVGALLIPGRESNFEAGRIMNHVYVTQTLDAAVWGAELAAGDGPGRVYFVEPQGPVEDDPNVTDKKLPGNPTRSYRTREPVKIVGELTDWSATPPSRSVRCRTVWRSCGVAARPSSTTSHYQVSSLSDVRRGGHTTAPTAE